MAATAPPMTVARRRALAVLAYGRRHAVDVTESNQTTPAQRFKIGDLSVYWSTVEWLRQGGYVDTTWRNGRRYVTLTPAGFEFAEAQDL